MLGQLAISYDNGETLCLSMGKNLLAFGIVEESDRTRKSIESITAEEIQAAAVRIFNKEDISRLTYL